MRQSLIDLPPAPGALFNIAKIYEEAPGSVESADPAGAVVLNGREMTHRYHERMQLEIPLIFDWFRTDDFIRDSHGLSRYRLLHSTLSTDEPDIDFVSGLPGLRLADFAESLLSDGPRKTTYLRQAAKYISGFAAAGSFPGRDRADSIVAGYKALRTLMPTGGGSASGSGSTLLDDYIAGLAVRAERATLDAVGLSWDGRISLRDSPHGPRVKFRVMVSVDGPREVELTSVTFDPYWDTIPVVLEGDPRIIEPHQSFVREYLIDVDPELLEPQRPESLLFTTELNYGVVPLVRTCRLPVWQAPDLHIDFEPDYTFVPPVVHLEVDRIVSSMAWLVEVTKPRDYSGEVQLKLETPRGVFAGAYQSQLALEGGRVRQMLRIPFTVSNLFEQGIHHPNISLALDGNTVTADTARMRIANTRITDTLTIGFLPDSTGQLEDILSLTEARYRPLTDRSLLVSDLEAYDVIIIGSGALRNYPSFKMARDRLEEFMRWGGSVVLMGQGYDWPEGVLPFSVSPAFEVVGREDIANPIDGARILSQPFKIDVSKLLSAFNTNRQVAAFIIAPAQRVFETPSQGSLLSVSRLGEGQLIYCGLPLVDMVATLELQAIHLFGNILNY